MNNLLMAAAGAAGRMPAGVLSQINFNANAIDDVLGPVWTETSGATVSGGALQLNGSTAWLSGSNTAAFTLGTSDFAAEAYVTLDSVPVYAGVIETRAVNGALPYIFGLFNTGGTIRPDIYHPNTGNVTGTTTGVTAGVKTHVLWTRAGGVLKMAVNGVFDSTTASAPSADFSVGATVVRVGRIFYGGGYEFFDGQIHSFRLHNNAYYGGSNFSPDSDPFPV